MDQRDHLENKAPVVFHVDVNSAYLSWEAVYRLYHRGERVDLREIPSAVGGDSASRRGIVLACSLPAKRLGVRTGESLWEARGKCPGLRVEPPNFWLYEKCSSAFLNLLRSFSPSVEPYSIDEAFVDMTGTGRLWGDHVEAARRMQKRIEEELGFTVNIGISTNKVLAKMASDFSKPRGLHTLFPQEIPAKLWPLPVGKLFFAGPAAERKLHTLGIRTIGELAGTDPGVLKAHLKKQGEILYHFAHGRGDLDVGKAPCGQKGYGNSVTLPFDAADMDTARLTLLALAETLGMRLRMAGVRAGRVCVSLRRWDFSGLTHQRTLASPVNTARELYEAAVSLLEEMWDGEALRQLGIYAGKIQRDQGVRQLNLFDSMDYSREEELEKAVDQVRLRHGLDSVKRAAFVGNRLHHMYGGPEGVPRIWEE